MNSRIKIIDIVAENFPNGIRDDFIDTNKVWRIYRAKYSEEISRKEIADVIRSKGLEANGRFYFISTGEAQHIALIVDEILAINSIVYYSVVHARHADFFMRQHIFSPEVLRKILRENGEHFYFDEFCSASRLTRLDYEVARVFMAEGNSLALDDLRKKLPYVPTEKLSAVLGTKKYLKTNAGKFIPVSKIHFDREEIQTAKQKIFSLVEENGSASVEDCDWSSNFALNDELAEKDLLNIIYKKFFSADFIRRGKKFFRKGTVIKKDSNGAFSHIRKFLADKSEVSVKELIAFSKKYDPAPSVALYVAHESMIRMEENLFVKDALINFDVAGVDESLDSFVQGKIISLRSVTSFTGFPSVAGYSWNLFMLESFLRKFSRKYSYASPSDNANNSNIGAIHPKSLKFEDYLELQVAVVIQEKVPLEKSAVEEFLIGQGFRKRRIDKVTERIIIRAQEIIDGRF